jgi:GTP cyclohydrolase I
MTLRIKDGPPQVLHKAGTELVTSHLLGCFRDNPLSRQEFLKAVA